MAEETKPKNLLSPELQSLMLSAFKGLVGSLLIGLVYLLVWILLTITSMKEDIKAMNENTHSEQAQWSEIKKLRKYHMEKPQ